MDERVGYCGRTPFGTWDWDIRYAEECPRENPNETKIDSCEECPYWKWET